MGLEAGGLSKIFLWVWKLTISIYTEKIVSECRGAGVAQPWSPGVALSSSNTGLFYLFSVTGKSDVKALPPFPLMHNLFSFKAHVIIFSPHQKKKKKEFKFPNKIRVS